MSGCFLKTSLHWSTNLSFPCENSTGVITLVHTDWIMARLSRMLAEFLKRSACQHIKIGCYSTPLLYSSPKNFILKGMTSLFKVEKTSEIYVSQQQNIVGNNSSNFCGKKYFEFGPLLLSLYEKFIYSEKVTKFCEISTALYIWPLLLFRRNLRWRFCIILWLS